MYDASTDTNRDLSCSHIRDELVKSIDKIDG